MEETVKGQYEAYPYPARRPDQQDALDSFGPLEELDNQVIRQNVTIIGFA